MQIRAGLPGDHEAVIDVWRDATVAFYGTADAVPEREHRAHAHLGDPDCVLVVAEDGGVVLGMATVTQARGDDGKGSPIPGLCHIGMVYVAPDRWGEGIGRQLVDRLLREARMRGYTAAQLYTPAQNDHAQRLYEGKGFRRSGRLTEGMGVSLVHYERVL